VTELGRSLKQEGIEEIEEVEALKSK